MKVTKRAKTVKVKFEEEKITRIVPKYTCPTCRTHFINHTLNPNVTRFICDCGQELIIEAQ